MTSIRVSITATVTDTGWTFTLACPEDGDWKAEREVRAIPGPESPRYPAPLLPCDPGPDHEHVLCEGMTSAHVQEMLEKFDSRAAGGVAAGDAIGRYLFDTLLAQDWPTIADMGKRLGCEVIELALTWSYQDQHGLPDSFTGLPLSQLPWELMRNGTNRYLCTSGQQPSVAVTRVVEGTLAEMPEELSVPPRVLFVVGTPVADRSVRAGAEMLALVREFRKAGCRIQHRVLEKPTPDRLRMAMQTFKPEIVHFISHGDVDSDGRGRIMLPSDDSLREMWRVDQLLVSLAVNGSLPPVVVLSACNSAGDLIVGPYRSAPLAAELVHGGIPVVVAMAGKVSDRVSRVFTRFFARALAQGESLVEATAHARRIAFAEGHPDSADWALPSIFFSAAVDPATVRCSRDPSAQHVDHLFTMARLNKDPVFCGREDFLRVFWAMLGDRQGRTGWEWQPGTRPSVLAVCSRHDQSGVGKTRLLEQFAREALQNGHLPLLVGVGSDSPPQNMSQLPGALAYAMTYLGQTVLGVHDDFGAELKSLFDPDWTDRHRVPGQEVADLAEALEHDCDHLRTAARRKYGTLFSDASRVVILIDNLGPASDPLLTALFDARNGLNDYGLGVSAEYPVPLVLVLITDEKDSTRRKLDTGGIKRPWLERRRLQPFDKDGEDMLAYEHVLLNPSPSGGELATRPWVFNRSQGPEGWSRITQLAQYFLRGLPISFAEELRFEEFLRVAQIVDLLDEADDIPAEHAV